MKMHVTPEWARNMSELEDKFPLEGCQACGATTGGAVCSKFPDCPATYALSVQPKKSAGEGNDGSRQSD